MIVVYIWLFIFSLFLFGVARECYNSLNKNCILIESFKYGNFPYITLKNNGKELCFILDTGANVNFIDLNALNNIQYSIYNNSNETVGLGGVIETNQMATVNLNMIYDDKKSVFCLSDNINFIIHDLSEGMDIINSEYKKTNICGILGNEFMNKHGIVIDYIYKRVYIRNTKAHKRLGK